MHRCVEHPVGVLLRVAAAQDPVCRLPAILHHATRLVGYQLLMLQTWAEA